MLDDVDSFFGGGKSTLSELFAEGTLRSYSSDLSTISSILISSWDLSQISICSFCGTLVDFCNAIYLFVYLLFCFLLAGKYLSMDSPL